MRAFSEPVTISGRTPRTWRVTDNPYAAMRMSLLALMQRLDEIEHSHEDVKETA